MLNIIILCGDFNIDLFNHHNNTRINRFMAILFNFNMYPLMDKLSNIFTNELNVVITSYLVMTGISGHLPLFYKCFMHNYQQRLLLNNLDRKSFKR